MSRGSGALLLLLGLGLSAKLDAQPTVPAVLERMSRAYAEMKSLRAGMVQRKSYPQLGLEDPPEKGEIAVKRKGPSGELRHLLVRVELRAPEIRIVTISEGRYLLYQPRIRQAIEGTLDRAGGARAGTSFLGFFLGGLAEAARDHDVSLVGEETIQERKTVRLRLLPKQASRAIYRQVDLWVDRERWFPLKQSFIESNQNEIRIEFERLLLNVEIPDQHFRLQLPPGVERVRG